jgi:hypothetical protein
MKNDELSQNDYSRRQQQEIGNNKDSFSILSLQSLINHFSSFIYLLM